MILRANILLQLWNCAQREKGKSSFLKRTQSLIRVDTGKGRKEIELKRLTKEEEQLPSRLVYHCIISFSLHYQLARLSSVAPMLPLSLQNIKLF